MSLKLVVFGKMSRDWKERVMNNFFAVVSGAVLFAISSPVDAACHNGCPKVGSYCPTACRHPISGTYTGGRFRPPPDGVDLAAYKAQLERDKSALDLKYSQGGVTKGEYQRAINSYNNVLANVNQKKLN